MSCTVALVELIKIDNVIVKNKLKLPNKEAKNYKKLLKTISKIRNVIAHSPRNPEMDFDSFVKKSEISGKLKKEYFSSKNAVLLTIENLDVHFRQINENIKFKNNTKIQ